MRTQRPAAAHGGPLAFCTIVSKNYLAQASVLAESVRRTNPGCPVYVLLVDTVDGYFRPEDEPFTVVPIADLPIPDLPRFCFQYTVLELNTAAKPYFLQYLFEQYGHDKLVYLDPDIMLFDTFGPLAVELDNADVVLTPHLTEPYRLDGKLPDEPCIMQAGTYNLGFVALRNSATSDRLLSWWQERLYADCRVDVAKGIFVDQKWMDLVPGYFERVRVLRDPGYNVAYWNLHARRVEVAGDRITVNGEPLYFFHFSGYNPKRPGDISKHQNRLTMGDVGQARDLYDLYEAKLGEHRHHEINRWPYEFGSFDNGEPVRDIMRTWYARFGDDARRFGNPFTTAHAGSFYRHLTEFASGEVPPLALAIHGARVDLQCHFPDPKGGDRERYMAWILAHAGKQYALAERYLVPSAVARAAAPTPATVPLLPKPSGHEAMQRPFGVNLAGYFSAEQGTSEAGRAVARALQAAGIPHCLNNLNNPYAESTDKHFVQFANDNPYSINVLQVNADQARHVANALPGYLKGHLNVGYWNWELSEFPGEWADRFALFDEVWTPSSFTQKAVASAASVPVQLVPFAITVPAQSPKGVGRGRFGIPRMAFTYLFAFDYYSFFARKNPLAAVEAFRRSRGGDPDALLVIKTVHAKADPANHARLLDAADACGNVKVIDEVLTRDEMHALMQACDCYVSLHRCEGYGLTLAEAMAYGKPVVGTIYSSVADFMNAENSRPVRYELVEIDRDYGPYRKGWLWADPDVDHAAEQMRLVREDRWLARRIGENARQSIRRDLSPERVGQMIYSRLMALLARKTAAGRPGEGLLDVRGKSGLPLRPAKRAA